MRDIVPLVDSATRHSFVASKLVKKYNLTANLNTSMVVMFADSSLVETCKTCSVPIITCTMSKKPVIYMV